MFSQMQWVINRNRYVNIAILKKNTFKAAVGSIQK